MLIEMPYAAIGFCFYPLAFGGALTEGRAVLRSAHLRLLALGGFACPA
jgi:hypothetical protein